MKYSQESLNADTYNEISKNKDSEIKVLVPDTKKIKEKEKKNNIDFK